MAAAFGKNLALGATALEAIPAENWNADRLLDTLRALAESEGLKLGDVMQPIRVALTGSTVSEPVNELLAVVGRESSLQRVREMAGTRAGV
jgi:glutamyl-tRNA synthetase